MKRRNKLLLFSPAFHPIDKLVETGAFKKKYQYLDYQKISPLDVVKHNVWVPRSIHSYHKIVSNLIIKWLTYLTPYFRASNFLYDFSRSSSITKFAETGIHKHQYFDYQMTTHTSRNAMHGYLKHLLFPGKQSTR